MMMKRMTRAMETIIRKMSGDNDNEGDDDGVDDDKDKRNDDDDNDGDNDQDVEEGDDGGDLVVLQQTTAPCSWPLSVGVRSTG